MEILSKQKSLEEMIIGSIDEITKLPTTGPIDIAGFNALITDEQAPTTAPTEEPTTETPTAEPTTETATAEPTAEPTAESTQAPASSTNSGVDEEFMAIAVVVVIAAIAVFAITLLAGCCCRYLIQREKLSLEQKAYLEEIYGQMKADLARNHDGECLFFFIPRDTFLRLKSGRMPGFRELAKAGVLVGHRISLAKAATGAYQIEFVAVSHRWMKKGSPDANGLQLAKLQQALRSREDVQWVWIDWMCMPQYEGHHKKTALEKDYFKRALQQVNLLYLFMHVFILFDADYQRRFWCLLESFMATHKLTANALEFVAGDDQGARKYDVITMGSMEGEEDIAASFVRALDKDVYVFLEKLTHDDVQVTNLSDKEVMIKKMQKFLPRLSEKTSAIGAEAAIGTCEIVHRIQPAGDMEVERRIQVEDEPASPDILQELTRRKASNPIVVPETIGAATNSMQAGTEDIADDTDGAVCESPLSPKSVITYL
jgi:hypothetical protein